MRILPRADLSRAALSCAALARTALGGLTACAMLPLLAAAARAQPAPGPDSPWVSEAGVDPKLRDAVRMGALATLAPLCGLRDGRWATDLRGAETEAAPARDLGTGALAYADHEALETFAETSPEAACARLARDPDLPRADSVVARHRQALAAGHLS